MKRWRELLGITIFAAGAGVAAAQTPVLGNIEAPYPALQTTVHIAGGTYGPGAVAYGPVGTPLVLSGSDLGGGGTVQFIAYKSGAPDTNASPVSATVTLWTDKMLILTVPSGAMTGLVKVTTTEGRTSNGLPFLVMNGVYAGFCPAGPTATQLQITTASLNDGSVGQSYSATLGATGGRTAYSWSIISGTLPSGLSLNASSGVISGMPTAASGPVDLTVQITDSSSPQQTDEAILSLTIEPQTLAAATVYQYTANSYDGVGNLTGYSDSIMGSWSLSYDSLNRLSLGTQTPVNGTPESFCWSYDDFGNRTAQAVAELQGSSSQLFTNPVGAATCQLGSGMLISNDWTIPATNNQISSTDTHGIAVTPSYDAAGDMTYDGQSQYLYDAEGRICAVESTLEPGFTTMTGYLYDAEGNRVAKGTITTMSCDPTTNGFQLTENYVLGPGGEELTMIDGQGNWQRTNVYAAGLLLGTYDKVAGAPALHFHLTDPLGTRRMQLGGGGSSCPVGQPETDIQSLPYGDQLASYPDQYACTYADDSTPLYYTGKERDTESGNDYFGARYYASSIGRFMSPDAPVDQHPADPQSWNLYSYVRNNPLILLDPSGNYSCNPTSMSQSQCDDFGSDLAKAKLDAATALSHEEISGDQYNAVTGALGAYGALNDGNGVTVNVGATGGYPGFTVADGGGDKTETNPTGQIIGVTIDSDLFKQGSSDNLLEAIAHEGSHVEDAEAWANAGFTAKANPSHFKTEFAAYGVTIAMGQALGNKYLAGSLPRKNGAPMPFWDSTKSSAENMLMQSSMIMNLYPDYKLKAFGENTKGSGYGTK